MKRLLFTLVLACSTCFGATNSFDYVKARSVLFKNAVFPSFMEFITNSPPGTMMGDTSGTNVYLNGNLVIIPWPDGGPGKPWGYGLQIMNDNSYSGSKLSGEINFCDGSITNADTVLGQVYARIDSTNALGGSGGGYLGFAVRVEDPLAQHLHVAHFDNRGNFIGELAAYSSGPMFRTISNWHGEFNRFRTDGNVALDGPTNVVKHLLRWGGTNTIANSSYLWTNGAISVGTSTPDFSMVYGNFGLVLHGDDKCDILMENSAQSDGAVISFRGLSIYSKNGAAGGFITDAGGSSSSEHTPYYKFLSSAPFYTGGLGYWTNTGQVVIYGQSRSVFPAEPVVFVGTNSLFSVGASNGVNGGVQNTMTRMGVGFQGWYETNVTLTWSSIAFTNTQTQTITFTGVKSNDVVTVGWPQGLESQFMPRAWASNNCVLVKYLNTGPAATPAAGVHRFIVQHFP